MMIPTGATSLLLRWTFFVVIGLTLETLYILQSCACLDGTNCQVLASTNGNALVAPNAPAEPPPKIDIFATDEPVEEVLDPIDPNMPFRERIQQGFAKYATTTFTGYCPGSTSTYQLQGEYGVKWVSEFTRGAHQHRGQSMHCLLARAVARHPEWPKFMLRVSESNAEQPYTLVSSIATAFSKHRVFVFPDFTWESWPEVGDWNTKQLGDTIMASAAKFGLPGTPEWLTQRDERAMWRGGIVSPTRMATYRKVKNLTETFDFESVYYVNDQLDPTKRKSREEHCRYRFLVHFNGLKDENYSPSLKWRMLCGSLVFAQVDPIFYEWWTVGMQPFVHYIPFTSGDDLMERVEEYKSKPEEAAKIAAAGYQMSKRAFEEMDDYVDEFLIQYMNATMGINQRVCTSKSGDKSKVAEFKTLQQLQNESKYDGAGGFCL